jgi:hypothetical protein
MSVAVSPWHAQSHLYLFTMSVEGSVKFWFLCDSSVLSPLSLVDKVMQRVVGDAGTSAQLRERSVNNFSAINLRLCQALDTSHLRTSRENYL